jgi:hypothetical protein
MMTFRRIMTIITLSAATLSLIACSGGRTNVESDLHIKGAPDWVNEGTNILKEGDGRFFHGVGMAPDVGDLSLQTSTADDRARSEVAKILTSYMQVVSRDYTAAAQGGSDAITEQSLSRQIENVTQINLTGSRIIGHWRDRKTNAVWSIAELDMKRVKDTVENVQDMNEGFKDYMKSRGDNIFDSMIEENK